jgi:chitin synthase
MANNTPKHTEDRLDALPPYLQSDTHLTAHLASRFHLNLPTAKLSSHGVVCFNNYTSSTRGPDGSKERSAMAAAEDLASRALTRLGTRGENQAVVFLGESGSGKTTVRSHFLSSILSMSGTPLSTKLSYAAFLFDSLTTTKSITTPTASKAGLFYELQYDTTSSSHPTLVGGKLLGHRLERRRLASVPIGERSFHIMYYLLAGTSAAEKHHLGLEESSFHNPAEAITHGFGHGSSQKRWRYLGHPTQLKVGINDAEGFQQFKVALRSLEFPRHDIAEICQVLATVMHIGQLEFITVESTAPAPDESGGYSHEGGEPMTVVKNRDTLATIAAFLGVSVNDLETSLSYKTQTLHRERVTIMLDPKGARKNADELAQTLYSLLVSYLLEQVNEKVCALEDAIGNTVSVVDFPGFAQSSSTTGSTLDQLLNNAATESLYQLTLKSFYEQQIEIMEAEDIPVPTTSYFDNTDAVRGLLKKGNGLLSILDDQMRRGRTDLQCLEALRKRFEHKNPAIEVSEAFSKLPGSNFASANEKASFTIKHFAGEVEYPIVGLLEDNADVVSGDVVSLVQSSRSDFVRAIFGQEALQTVHHAQERTAVVQAMLSSKPSRKPSVAKRRGSIKPLKPRASRSLEDTTEDGSKPTNPFRNREVPPANTSQGAAGEFLSSLSTITEALSMPNTNAYTVFCLKPNDRRIANQFDSKCVRSQLQTLGIAEMSQRLKTVDFSVFVPFGEFLGLAEQEDFFVGSEQEKAERVIADKHWPENEARAGSTGVLLSERCWAEVSNVGRGVFPQSRYRDTSMDYDEAGGSSTPIPRLRGNDSTLHLLGTPSPAYHDEKSAGYFARELDVRSDAGTAFVTGDMFRNLDTREELAEKGNQKKMEEVDDIVVSGSRKRWVFLVWLMTFFVPDFAIRKFGGIKRKDIRMAWREKLAINLLIWCSCGFMVFFIGKPGSKDLHDFH